MFKGSPFDKLDLDICCQDHDREWFLKDFNRLSLSVKILIKNGSNELSVIWKLEWDWIRLYFSERWERSGRRASTRIFFSHEEKSISYLPLLTGRNKVYNYFDPHGFVTFHARRGSLHIFSCLRCEMKSIIVLIESIPTTFRLNTTNHSDR